MIRILIADDHYVVMSGLRELLEAQRDWEVIGEATTGRDAVSKAIELKPDIAIVDYSLGLMTGVEVTRQIRTCASRTEVLMFTMYDSDVIVREALKAGVRGYLLKSDAGRYLIEAIRSLAVHKAFFSPTISEERLKSFAKPNGALPITDRERTIVRMIAEGHSNKAIARILGISLKTVETHRAAAMRKLDLGSSAALVRYAIRHNIAEA